ncbi:hypothetical protein ACF1BN_15790 [Streptomyces sp. NPDC014861]|uniref:hypothetical protein n=1 Tax=Streptomyces sp. NPDC014861 TaxID=3364923 RepID=UPI0036F627D3
MVWTPFLAGEVVEADALNKRIIEVLMDWTPLSSLGSFASGFTPNPAMAPAMQITREMGVVHWRYQGRINNATPANVVNTTQVMFTFTSTDHRPAVERGGEMYAANSSHYPVRLGLMTNGTLTASVPSAAAGASTIWLDTLWIPNPK